MINYQRQYISIMFIELLKMLSISIIWTLEFAQKSVRDVSSRFRSRMRRLNTIRAQRVDLFMRLDERTIGSCHSDHDMKV